jgi:hypothetical protein
MEVPITGDLLIKKDKRPEEMFAPGISSSLFR